VDWVHNPEIGRRFGPRWTQGQNATGVSPECGLIDDARAQSSLRLQKKIEGILLVLTMGFGDRGYGGVRSAVKRRWRRWRSVSCDWGCREERRRGATSAVQRGGGGGAFYRAEEVVESRGVGRRWSITPHQFQRS
jgi:hypothetical protein